MSDNSPFGGWFGRNRHMCDVLKDMRALSKSRNYSSLDSLIEELQYMANKMEAGLMDQKDLNDLTERQSRARKELKKLETEYKKLTAKIAKLRKKKS